MKPNIYCILQMIIIFLVSSCTCRKCGDPDTSSFYDDSISIAFIDKKTGKNLYPYFDPNNNQGYNKDSIQIFDQVNTKILIEKYNYPDYYIFYTYPYSKKDPIEKDTCRTLCIKHSKLDIDTLKVCYKVAQGKCYNYQFIEYAQVYFNNKLTSNGNGGGLQLEK